MSFLQPYVDSVAEKVAELRLLCDKYSPGIDPVAEIDKFLKAVLIVRIEIEHITGKEAIELVRARKES